MSSNPSPEQVERRSRYDASRGCDTLRLLTRLLYAAGDVAHGFLLDHPDGCGCDHCGYAPRFAPATRDDVQGARWAVYSSASQLDSVTVSDDEPDRASLGDQLRRLAELADRLYADDPGPAEVEPTAVVG